MARMLPPVRSATPLSRIWASRPICGLRLDLHPSRRPQIKPIQATGRRHLATPTSTPTPLLEDLRSTGQLTNKVVLRPYQQEAVEKCQAALARGLTRIGVSSPTGSGKTTMFMHLIPPLADVQPPIQRRGTRGQTLIVVGSVELALQAENAAKRILGDGWSVEVEQSRRHASGTADV